MKKFILSAAVLATFFVYALYDRLKSSPTLTAPPSKNPTYIPSSYRDGEYLGDVTDAYYGNVQVKATIQSGQITDIQFLDYPRDRRTSIIINTRAMPLLISEAIQAQNADVDIISGATQTSAAFRISLRSALTQAKIQL